MKKPVLQKKYFPERSSRPIGGRLGVAVLFIFILGDLFAQDPHYSQYDAAPVVLNPALTGPFGGPQKYRVATQYRSQWGLLGGRIATSSLSYDMVYQGKWGIGGYMLDYDAPGNYNALNAVVSGAYKISGAGQEKQLLTVGLQAGIINKNNKDLVFDNQYSFGNFDPDLPSGESYRKYSIVMPEVNMGISYKQSDKEKKINPYGGFSVFHITRPREKFFQTSPDSRLPMRFVLNGGSAISVTERVTLDPHFLWMKQKKANDIIFGLRGNYDFKNGSNALNNSIAILSGVSYRLRDAVIGELGVKYKNFVYKFSYDFTVSTLRSFNNGKGALELSVVYKGN